MMKVCFLVVLAALGVGCEPPQADQIREKVAWLHERLQSNYCKKDQNYIFGVQWQKHKGIFDSKVHFNFLDHRNLDIAAFLRDREGVPDINMFVTSFVLYGLLEAEALGTLEIDHHQFSLSLEAIGTFRDRNTPEGVPQYVFWPQVNKNGSYSASPTNLVKTINMLPQMPLWAQEIAALLGLGIFANAQAYIQYFVIPADNDDSSVNMALLAMMKEFNSPHYPFWNSLNSKKQEYYDRALKYAYRPFDTDLKLNPQADQIDPRTYFVLRDFLQMKKASSNPSLILPTTWLLDESEIVADRIVMPFSTNNVDASVCANFLFGLSYQILMGEVSIERSPQLRQMMLDTVELLEYTVKQVLAKRPSLILVYYPSRYDFFWFVARSLHLLKRHSLSKKMPEPLPEIKERLQSLVKGELTDQILAHAQKEGQTVFWSEFLGNYANKQRNEDAIFSSSLALNALLDSWAVRQGSSVTFDEGTPQPVKDAIHQGIQFLLNHIKPGMNEINAFFSGSVKEPYSTFPSVFPANHVYDQGKQIDPTQLTARDYSPTAVATVKGIIDPQEYEEMLKKKWYGFDVPVDEQSLNKGYGATFPFWSSNAIGEIMAITSLSKYLRIQESVAVQLHRE